MPMIRLVDLDTQRARIADRIDATIARVLAHGQYIMGPEIAAFESAFAEFCGVHHVVSVSSGTDALVLPLMAWKIGPRDAIREARAARQIPTMVYYPRALTQQTAYKGCPTAPGGVPVAEELAASVLSLPMHPYLEEAHISAIVAAVREAV